MTAMLPAHLTETLNNLGDAARALADEVRADKDARALHDQEQAVALRRHNLRVTTLLVVVALLVGGLVWLSIANRRLGVANSALNRQNAQIVEQIRSCTTVGGTCYEEGSRRTARVIQQVNMWNLYLVQCAKATNTEGELEACVAQRFKDEGAAPPLAPTPTPSPGPTPSAAQDDDRTP